MAVHRHLHRHPGVPAVVWLAGLQGAAPVHPALDLRLFRQQPAAVRRAVCPQSGSFVDGPGLLHLVVGVQPAEHLAGLERARRPVFHRARQAPVRPAGGRGQPGRAQWPHPGHAAGGAAGPCRVAGAGHGVPAGQRRRHVVPATLANAPSTAGASRAGRFPATGRQSVCRCHCRTALALPAGHCPVRGVARQCQHLPVFRTGAHRQRNLHRPYPANPGVRPDRHRGTGPGHPHPGVPHRSPGPPAGGGCAAGGGAAGDGCGLPVAGTGPGVRRVRGGDGGAPGR
ncbi:hypothetical protein D3C80_373730 [compost metagenome]